MPPAPAKKNRPANEAVDIAAIEGYATERERVDSSRAFAFADLPVIIGARDAVAAVCDRRPNDPSPMEGIAPSMPAQDQPAESESSAPTSSLNHPPSSVSPFPGFPVRIMTPRDYARLVCGRSPFLVGGVPTLEAVAQFLWMLSPDFTSDAEARDEFFARVLAAPDDAALVSEIEEYLDMVFCDMPPGKSGQKENARIASLPATLADIFENEYHWPPGAIDTQPIPALFQRLACIRHRHNPKLPVFDPARTRAVGARLRAKKKDRETKPKPESDKENPNPEVS